MFATGYPTETWDDASVWICHRLTARSFKSTYVLACERMRALIPTLLLNRGGPESQGERSASRPRGG